MLITATLHDGQKIDFIPDQIGEGGMKRVFFTADKKSVLCFFKDQNAAMQPNNQRRLEALLGKWNPTVGGQHAAYFADLFCWPTGIVVDPALGIMTPAYPSNFFFATGQWKGKEKDGMWFASPKLRKRLPPAERGDFLNYLKLCILMARGVRKMHLTGLAHSDLSCRNVLIDPPGGRCTIIDVDALVVPGLHPPEVLGTPGYIAPEVIATQNLGIDDPKKKLPSNLTDLHALPVLFYQYFLRRHPLEGPKVNAKPDKTGNIDTAEDVRLSMGEKALFIEHPTDASNRPSSLTQPFDVLGPHLRELFLKAFVDGLHTPSARPTASAWEDRLCKTSDLIVPCGNSACEEKWFVYLEKQALKCPWCGWKPAAAFPVLDFHYAPQRGAYRPEGRCLVGFDNRPLNLWHVYTHFKPVEGVDREPLALIRLHQGQWLIQNRSLDWMESQSGNPVPRGSACRLGDGDQIVLSKEDKGRMITVRFIR